jgi:hypothetical protein
MTKTLVVMTKTLVDLVEDSKQMMETSMEVELEETKIHQVETHQVETHQVETNQVETHQVETEIHQVETEINPVEIQALQAVMVLVKVLKEVMMSKFISLKEFSLIRNGSINQGHLKESLSRDYQKVPHKSSMSIMSMMQKVCIAVTKLQSPTNACMKDNAYQLHVAQLKTEESLTWKIQLLILNIMIILHSFKSTD